MLPIVFVLLVCVNAADATLNDDSRCWRQVTQFCGKLSKFFGVAGNATWRDGLPENPTRGCDGSTDIYTSPPTSESCGEAFPALMSPVATVIGNSRLWNWCSNSLCATLYVHETMGRQPVIVCHDAGFNASSCCIEPGQLPPENFTSMASCTTNATSTMLPLTAKSGMPGTTLLLTDKPGMPEPDAPSNPLDAPLILGVAGGVALVVLIGVVVSIVQWRRRRAGASVPEPSHYGILPPAKGAPTYDDVTDVQRQGPGMYDAPSSPLYA